MMSSDFSGNSIEDIAKEAKKFSDLILGMPERAEGSNETDAFSIGYRPDSVGRPERNYCPIDDGREWDKDSIQDWIGRLREDGREVVRILAKKKVIDPREEARILGWSGSSWAGVWTGPRRQARYVIAKKGLMSWPYGHTYVEPKRMWMHEDIANIVLDLVG